jgi:hypothetical protein
MSHRDIGACAGKHRFNSMGLARNSIRANAQGNLRAYGCEVCSGYHVGGHMTSHKRDRRVLHRSTIRVLQREERDMLDAQGWERAA